MCCRAAEEQGMQAVVSAIRAMVALADQSPVQWQAPHAPAIGPASRLRDRDLKLQNCSAVMTCHSRET